MCIQGSEEQNAHCRILTVIHRTHVWEKIKEKMVRQRMSMKTSSIIRITHIKAEIRAGTETMKRINVKRIRLLLKD